LPRRSSVVHASRLKLDIGAILQNTSYVHSNAATPSQQGAVQRGDGDRAVVQQPPKKRGRPRKIPQASVQQQQQDSVGDNNSGRYNLRTRK
jgi:hypothetical protein